MAETTTATSPLDQYFPEMRWRLLSLAADLDRVERLCGPAVIDTDRRLLALREAMSILHDSQLGAGRAERVQMIFSDTSPPPAR